MDEKNIILEECPCCRGNGLIVHEGGWNVQVECADCGSHTVYLDIDQPVAASPRCLRALTAGMKYSLSGVI